MIKNQKIGILQAQWSTSISENVNKNVFFTVFLLIIILSHFPLLYHYISMGPDCIMFRDE